MTNTQWPHTAAEFSRNKQNLVVHNNFTDDKVFYFVIIRLTQFIDKFKVNDYNEEGSMCRHCYTAEDWVNIESKIVNM